ncbi:MAG: imidazole glycerol phosphate synthase subunit HisH [Actinobacteria bacterium]|nr:imidazole glycerol phosphate synthase subunit HisH [Actinomycetota bacterium]
MIAIIDYGMGNLRSVEKALQRLGYDALVTSNLDEIAGAAGVILPGVGAFADCMSYLEVSGLREAVLESIDSSRPFLGICLGLQLLFTQSEENGVHPGLGVLSGNVRRFPANAGLKVPHMGWNQINFKKRSPLFTGLESGTNVYFVHSYYVEVDDPSMVASTTDYGPGFVSSVQIDNVFACQFHPEKSGEAGLAMLDNFARLCR